MLTTAAPDNEKKAVLDSVMSFKPIRSSLNKNFYRNAYQIAGAEKQFIQNMSQKKY